MQSQSEVAKTHTQDDKRKFNNANNKLRGALRELNNDAFSINCINQERGPNHMETDHIPKKAADPVLINPFKHKPPQALGLKVTLKKPTYLQDT